MCLSIVDKCHYIKRSFWIQAIFISILSSRICLCLNISSRVSWGIYLHELNDNVLVIGSDFLHVLDSCRDVYKLFAYDTQYIALDMDFFKRVLLLLVFFMMITGAGWGWVGVGGGGQIVKLIKYSVIWNKHYRNIGLCPTFCEENILD